MTEIKFSGMWIINLWFSFLIEIVTCWPVLLRNMAMLFLVKEAKLYMENSSLNGLG